MSFSGKVKEELAKHISSARHCQLAELAAILHFCGQYGRDADGTYTIGFETENELLVRKGFTLLKKTFNIDTGLGMTEDNFWALSTKIGDLNEAVSPLLVKNSCCRRAFLRGAFLSVGSISDPNKGYHLEFVCTIPEQAEQIKELMGEFDIIGKIVRRKKYFVVYVKEGSAIVDLLNVLEAHKALMEFENLRILKEMRNSINRKVNCEAANINKTVNAAAKQIEDIIFLRDYYGLENLPEPLRQTAGVRLEYPDSSLKELGELMDPPVGKSGVNHRLRKLCELAEKIR
ncbi:MAG: DNA-binding protein WhiA [Acetatifactor sp.]|nr:DNA-binding protein WhiA [Acetatifactor sp.]